MFYFSNGLAYIWRAKHKQEIVIYLDSYVPWWPIWNQGQLKMKICDEFRQREEKTDVCQKYIWCSKKVIFVSYLKKN